MAHPDWWQRAVLYQIYPRSFQDADGDGVGDIEGIGQRLDHLVELGVDALWLSPVFPSPMADFGYDVSDYCDIDPLFGTLADFDALLADAHARGLKVILDLVPNHTSDQHPWFQESRASRTSIPSATGTSGATRRPAAGRPTTGCRSSAAAAWEYDAATGQYYYHAFLTAQPDLNWRNPGGARRHARGAALLAGARRRRLPRRRHLASDQGRRVPRQPAQSRLP